MKARKVDSDKQLYWCRDTGALRYQRNQLLLWRNWKNQVLSLTCEVALVVNSAARSVNPGSLFRQGHQMREGTNPSWFNPVEAVQIMMYCCKLTKKFYNPLKPTDIGIIAPYRKQVRRVALRCFCAFWCSGLVLFCLHLDQRRLCFHPSAVREDPRAAGEGWSVRHQGGISGGVPGAGVPGHHALDGTLALHLLMENKKTMFQSDTEEMLK